MRVLIAEDDEVLAKALAAGLRREGMAVDAVLSGDDASEHLSASSYDVIVLDRDLPGIHGDDICRSLAASRAECRVLMLTAARSVKDRVEGLELGADDYLPKPFDFAELVARIRALARRATAPRPDEAADPFTSTVKTTIRRLRAKLGDPPLIETVRESGYRIGGPSP